MYYGDQICCGRCIISFVKSLKTMLGFRTARQFFRYAGYVASMVDHGMFPTFLPSAS